MVPFSNVTHPLPTYVCVLSVPAAHYKQLSLFVPPMHGCFHLLATPQNIAAKRVLFSTSLAHLPQLYVVISFHGYSKRQILAKKTALKSCEKVKVRRKFPLLFFLSKETL